MKALFIYKPGFNLKDYPKELLQILRDADEVITTHGMAGKCRNLVVSARGFETQGRGYVQDIEEMVAHAMDNDVDLLITAGGDGTAGYVASAALMHRRDSRRIRLLAFPAGTANIGPIVHRIDKEGVGLEDMKEVELDALEVRQGDRLVGYAFNDVIIGNTYLGTLDNKVTNLDARALALEGRTVRAEVAQDIVDGSFRVELNGKEVKVGGEIRQICASPLHAMPRNPHVVMGGLVQCIGYEHPAAIAFLDRNLTSTDEANWDIHCITRTTHLCFNGDDVVRLSGFTDDAQIIVDGNPFIRTERDVSLRMIPKAVTALWADD